jgi:hypothetical protein
VNGPVPEGDGLVREHGDVPGRGTEVNGPVPVCLDPVAQAGALASLLARLGFAVRLFGGPGGGEYPGVAVSAGMALGYVHAALDPSGVQRFWLTMPGEQGPAPGGPLCEVSRTADTVGRALARAAQARLAAENPGPAGPSAVTAA